VSVILPTLVLVIIYGLIYREIHKIISKSKESRARTIAVMNRNTEVPVVLKEDEAIQELERRELKVTRKLGLIVVSFVSFWLVSFYKFHMARVVLKLRHAKKETQLVKFFV
jgi:hypothetical protein